MFPQPHRLHPARHALLHELKSLISPIVDGVHLLLGEASFHQVYRLAPTKEKRELGHLLISGRSRSGKGLYLEAQLLSWPASAIVNCSELRISVAPLDNMAGFQLTLLENLARTPLILCENGLALTKNSLITSVPAHVR